MKKITAIILVSLLFVLLFMNMFDSDFNFNKMDQSIVDGQYYTENPTSANMVTSVVVDYRSFDTLGEVTVLFVSSLGVAFILGGLSTRIKFKHTQSFILKVGTDLLFGMIILLGAYMFIHGHLTPGGGFPGGALIGAAFLLKYIGDDSYRAKISAFKALEGTMGSIYVLIGIIGILAGNYFLENILDLGTLGNLVSGGLIPIIYVLIGLKVGSELTGIFDHFVNEEV